MLVNIGIKESKIIVVEDNIGGSNVNEWDENNRFECGGLTYRKLDESTMEICSCDEKKAHIVIPDNLFISGREYIITQTGNFAFANNLKVNIITLNDKIESIGESAFNGCSNLEYVYVGYRPSYISKIGNCAFDGCSKLESAIYAKEIGEFAFQNSVL